MLMIHVGPLFSAAKALGASQAHALVPHHHQHHGDHGQEHVRPASSSSHHQHHRRHAPTEPAWLAGLDLCGYCELLTFSPPLTLSLDLALPWYAPAFIEPLPEKPLRLALRRSSGHPRAPPTFHV